jgi:hypothetical protein
MIIGLIGHKGEGKSSVAKILHGLNGFAPAKFAGPLKTMLYAFYKAHGLAPEAILDKIEGNLKEVPCMFLAGRTPRYAMQTLGTEWGRNLIHDQLWIKSLQERLKNGESNIVVDDCRFLNEAAALRESGAKLVRVYRASLQPDKTHPSEIEIPLIPVDYVIDNSGPIEALPAKVDRMLTFFEDDGA